MVATLEHRLPQASFTLPGYEPNPFWSKPEQPRVQPITSTTVTATYVPPVVEGVPIRDSDLGFQVQEQFLSGKHYLLAGRFAEAADVFESIVKEFPSSYAAHFNLGFAYGRLLAPGMPSEHALELIEKSLEHFTKASTLRPTDADSHYCKVLPHIFLGRLKEAETELNLALEYELNLSEYPRQELPWLHYFLAWQFVWVALRDSQEESLVYLQKAERLFSKAIELRGKDSWPLYSLGVVYYELGRRNRTERDPYFEKAINAYKESLKYDSINSQAYNDLGVVYQAREDYLAAIKPYRKAIEINPKNIAALHNLGNSLLFLRRYTEALGIFSQTLKLSPEDIVALNGLGAAYVAVGMYEEARAVLSHALNNDASSVVARVNLGVLNYKLGDLQAAEQLFLESLKTDPVNTEAEHNLGVVRDALATEGQDVTILNSDSYGELQDFFNIRPEVLAELLDKTSEPIEKNEPTNSHNVYKNLQHIKQSLEGLFGPEEIKRWLHTPKAFLHGKSPIEMIIEGHPSRVLDALVRLEEGIPN